MRGLRFLGLQTALANCAEIMQVYCSAPGSLTACIFVRSDGFPLVLPHARFHDIQREFVVERCHAVV